MKCDELEEEYLWTNNVKTHSTIMVRVYNADEVDAAIAELKARIQLDDDEMAGFLQLEEECGGGDLRNYIAELKQKLHDAEIALRVKSEDCVLLDEQIERFERKQRQTLHDAEMRADLAEAAATERKIDYDNLKKDLAYHARQIYFKHNRQTLRALWLARANMARGLAEMCEHQIDCCGVSRSRFLIGWDKELKPKRMTTTEWGKLWRKVEQKCRAKADTFKEVK